MVEGEGGRIKKEEREKRHTNLLSLSLALSRVSYTTTPRRTPAGLFVGCVSLPVSSRGLYTIPHLRSSSRRRRARACFHRKIHRKGEVQGGDGGGSGRRERGEVRGLLTSRR